MIHYLYVGHFERDGTFIRFEKVGDTKPALYRPVVHCPLDPIVVSELLNRWHTVQIPAQWGMTIDDSGYMVWDRFCGNDDAADFVVELSKHTGCDLADFSSLTLMSADDLKKPTNR